MADPTRRVILGLLKKGPSTVGEIAGKLTVSRPAVSQHLKVLKTARLVQEDRQGTRHYFGLNPAGFASLRDEVDAMWQEALEVFAAYVALKEKAKKKTKRSRQRKET
jgi:DNA-binding transcriptional ArsR family regulator